MIKKYSTLSEIKYERIVNELESLSYVKPSNRDLRTVDRYVVLLNKLYRANYINEYRFYIQFLSINRESPPEPTYEGYGVSCEDIQEEDYINPRDYPPGHPKYIPYEDLH